MILENGHRKLLKMIWKWTDPFHAVFARHNNRPMWSVKKYQMIIVIWLPPVVFIFIIVLVACISSCAIFMQFSREKRLKADFTDVNVELCHKCGDLQKRRLLLGLLWCHKPLVNPKWNISVFSIWLWSTAQSKQSLWPKFHFGKICGTMNRGKLAFLKTLLY